MIKNTNQTTLKITKSTQRKQFKKQQKKDFSYNQMKHQGRIELIYNKIHLQRAKKTSFN